ncbi:MAG: acetylxylan esterase [Candidatus Hydrogenedentes bacterium]|nr:acetylxylan esterase [Candidatus Hydrogenedentota bacterium]
MVDLTKIASLSGWPDTRKELEDSFNKIMRVPKYEETELQVRVQEENETHGVSRRQIIFFLNDVEMVSGWLFIPEGKEEVPGILCCHHESIYGKDESAGLGGNSQLAFAQHYAELGYVTLAIDAPTVGRRAEDKVEPYNTDSFYKENEKLSFAGKMLADHSRALDVFSEIKRVDTTRIGVIGHGLGGLNALLLTAYDDRIQTCVASCGFTRFATDKCAGKWPGQENLLLFPEVIRALEAGDLTFDWEHILSLIVPTPVQIITSVSNSLHNNPKSCQKAVKIASKIYKLLGASSALDCYPHYDGHVVTSETLEVADEWFERWL